MQLKKVNQSTYTVWDSKKGKTFATLNEANAYERAYRKRTGEFVSITKGERKVTHKYK